MKAQGILNETLGHFQGILYNILCFDKVFGQLTVEKEKLGYLLSFGTSKHDTRSP